MSEENTNAEQFKPHNVLGMATKAVYLTDPMTDHPTTSEDEPVDVNSTDTSLENPDKGKNKQDHNWEERWSNLKTHYDNQKNQWDTTVNDLKTQVNALKDNLKEEEAKKRQMPKTPEEFKSFKEKYPELADMIITAAMQVVEDGNANMQDKMRQLEETTAAVRAKEGLNELKKLGHDDVDELKDDPKFHAWFNAQSEAVKNLIRSPDPKVIAEGLDLYKLKNGLKRTTAEKAEATKNATRVPSSNNKVTIEDTGKRKYKESEIYKMSLTDFEKNQDDIRAARYDGRILIGQ